ncbi:hypothetical protein KA005_46255, partial [bacterium]|nr:hypothetical protein [bacterium]
DEVLAVGDAAFQKKCLGKMKDVATGGRTVLFVSHNMAAINSICKRAIILENSQIAYSGYTAEVIDNYLRGKEASKNERLEWIAPDKELPFSDVVKIKSYYIQDEEGNIVKNNLLNSKKYNVVLELELFKNDPRLIFELLYYSNNEEVIFATDVHDSGFIDFGALKRGKFKLAVPVPVELFWNRSYKIELICALHWTGWILPPNNSSKMEFNFFRDRDLNPYSGDYRIGALAPVLPWKVEYLEG